MKTNVVLFTRDLRVHDHPALSAAVERAERIVPLFVLDDAVLAAFGGAEPRRLPARRAQRISTTRCASAARRSCSAAATSWPRRSELAQDVERETVHISADVSAYAQERERRLRTRARGARGSSSTCHPASRSSRPATSRPRAATTSRLHALLAALARGPRAATSGGAARGWRSRTARGRDAARAPTSWYEADAVPELPAGGETARAPAPRRVARRRARTLRGARRRPRRRRDLAALALPALRLRLAGEVVARARDHAGARAVRAAALLARLPPPGAGRASRSSRARDYRPRGATAGATTTRRSTPGARAAPATRSSTPACASCGARAACTTAPGWSPPPS